LSSNPSPTKKKKKVDYVHNYRLQVISGTRMSSMYVCGYE
jgi:hypothetical protein